MDEFPVKVGAMLYTLVDPNRGHEVAYNRWYERDHFYGGVMVGPGTLAGGRWVARRAEKDLRFPTGVDPEVAVADPLDAGSYLATYFISADHVAEHFAWANAEVFKLYEAGRGFAERTHAHTALYLFRRAHHRDADGVPVELALDHRFAGLVSLHVDRAEGVSADDLDDWLAGPGRERWAGDDSPVAIVATWRPIIPKGEEGKSPMKLGSGPGTPARSMLLAFCDAAPADHWDRFRALGDAIDASGLATVRLAAPFIPTVVGTDTYADQLW